MAEIAPDILARAQGGEAAAFDELVRFYRQDLLRVTYRFVGNYEDARDVLQLVFIKVYQNIERWEPRAPFWMSKKGFARSSCGSEGPRRRRI